MNAVELGKINLLVEQGHSSNRTDFIRSAIRSQLDKHTVEVQQMVIRASYVVGAFSYNRADFERYKSRNEKVKLNVVGLCNLTSDISPTLAAESRVPLS